jgi:hypothetical protein
LNFSIFNLLSNHHSLRLLKMASVEEKKNHLSCLDLKKKLDEFSQGDETSLFLSNINTPAGRGQVHEQARERGYFSKTWYTASEDVELFACPKCKNGKQIVKIPTYCQDWELAFLDEDGNLMKLFSECNNCHAKSDSSKSDKSYKSDKKIPRKWVATNVVMILKSPQRHKQVAPPTYSSGSGTWKSRNNFPRKNVDEKQKELEKKISVLQKELENLKTHRKDLKN